VVKVNKYKSIFVIDLHYTLILGEGRSVYEKNVLPLFEEANINVETIYTERANHARDYIDQQSLDHYDGLVSVGGDGMFSELCHSLLLKTAQQAGLNIDDSNVHLKRPNLRLGVIPAGSTDAVAFGTTGHNDPITNALQIIVGESLLIDIATVGILISRIFQTKDYLL
jgi:ceramide kinase